MCSQKKRVWKNPDPVITNPNIQDRKTIIFEKDPGIEMPEWNCYEKRPQHKNAGGDTI